MDVTEDLSLLPLTDYSKYKAMCEEVLEEEREPGFTAVTLRPATVCGYAPRLRLDLTVNILTSHAINNGASRCLAANSCAQPSRRGHDRSLPDAAGAAGRGGQRQDVECRLSQSESPRDRRHGARGSRPQGRYRGHAERRPSLLSRFVGADPARHRLRRRTHGQGRDRRSENRIHRRQGAERHDRRPLLQHQADAGHQAE